MTVCCTEGGIEGLIKEWISVAKFRIEGYPNIAFVTVPIVTLTNTHIFFHWHYSPLWALACRTVSFHFFLFATNSLHLLTPSTFKISFYFLFPSFPVSSPSSRPFQFLSEDLLGILSSSILSLGDLTSLSFALLSILLYFLLRPFLLVLDSSDFSIPRLHI